MSIWSTIVGFFTGASSIAGAVGEVAKTAGKITDEVHDKNERTAGADHVHAEDNAASAKVNANVAQAAIATDDRAVLDGLRKGKF
jgi:hypothetical protein